MARTRQALIDELGRAMQAYQRSTQAFDDEVGRALDLNPADLRCLDWLTEGPMTATRIARGNRPLDRRHDVDDRPAGAQGVRAAPPPRDGSPSGARRDDAGRAGADLGGLRPAGRRRHAAPDEARRRATHDDARPPDRHPRDHRRGAAPPPGRRATPSGRAGDRAVVRPAAARRRTASRQRRIAATDRSASASVVLQFETEIRIAARPCQVVPPSQHVPSAWTAAMTARVKASASPPSPGSNRTRTWFSTTSLRIVDARRSRRGRRPSAGPARSSARAAPRGRRDRATAGRRRPRSRALGATTPGPSCTGRARRPAVST